MVHWQLPFLSEKEKFHLELLMEMMTSPVYDYLRTQKSLGYTVYNHFYNYEQQGGAYFYILTQGKGSANDLWPPCDRLWTKLQIMNSIKWTNFQ